MLEGKTVALIGAGVMAEVLVSGLLRGRVLDADDIVVSHYRQDRLEEFRQIEPVRSTTDNAEAYRVSDISVICVQPSEVGAVLDGLRPAISDDRLLVTIAAGLPSRFYEERLGHPVPLVRAMPTFYGRVGIGTTAVALNDRVSAPDLAAVTELFRAISEEVVVMKESEMNAFTTFSSTTAAAVYMLLDALFSAGSLVGLSHGMSHSRALEQVIAAAQNVEATGKLPSELVDEICTPGGVTVEGVKVLEERALRGALIDGVLAANERAREIEEQSRA